MSSPAPAFRPSESLEVAWLDAARRLNPPPQIPLDEWLDENFRVDGQPWRPNHYQRGIAQAISDPAIEQVTVYKSARVGFTKLCVGYIAYRIALDPCRMLVVQPTKDDAEGFSKEDLTPSCEDMEAVRGLMAESKGRSADSTITRKTFLGGWCRIGGAHTGRTFRRIGIDVGIADEVDGYPPSAGGEGDQLSLLKRRAHRSLDRKFLIGSTPWLQGASKIIREYERSDQRRFMVPCPHCDAGQPIEWGGRDVDYGLKWPKDEAPADHNVYYLCAHCHEVIDPKHQGEMVQQGVWEATHPEVEKHAGFRIWSALNDPAEVPDDWWPRIAQRFYRVRHNPVEHQPFVNTELGLPWEEKYQSLSAERLELRAERYPLREGTDPRDPDYLVPTGVVTIDAGVDVQGDRFEAQVHGYGLGEECWALRYSILDGDPTGDAVWAELFRWMKQPFAMERGGFDYIRSTCIDSRYLTTQVVKFCKTRRVYRRPDQGLGYLFATMGKGGPGKFWPKEPQRDAKGHAGAWTLHVDNGKDTLSQRIEHVAEPGPGYFHIPDHREFRERWRAGMEAEKVTLDHDARGFLRRVWKLKHEGGRNESWDTAVLCLAALKGWEHLGFDLEREARKIAQRAALAGRVVPTPEPPPPALPPVPAAIVQPHRRIRRRTTNAFGLR